MRVTNSARIIAGTALLALGLAACGGESSTDGGTAAAGQPVRMELGEPQKLFYPGDTTESEGAEVLGAVFAPLVRYDENKQVVNDVAESIKSTDNKVWTIELKPGYTWQDSAGTALTAQNYVDAWNYSANQDNVQGANGFFSRIEGWADLNPGEGKTVSTKEMKGLKVVDDTTFKVTLTEPFSQFKTMLGYTAFYPLPKAAFGDDGKVTEAYAKQPIGQGYFKMDAPYNKGTSQTIDLTRYDKFPGEKPKFDKLQFKLYTSAETAFNDLRAGNLDIHDSLPPSAVASAKAELGERYIDQADAGVGYIGFPLQYNKIYSDIRIREAISMAIDRKTIADTVFSGTRAPADDFINPLLDGYRQGACAVCTYDPAKAKAQYAEAGGPKTLELGYNSDGPHKEWIEAVANNLRANLDVQVSVKPFEKFASILDELDDKTYGGMFRMGWAIDYPSAENYLTPVFSTIAIKTGSNYAGWSNKEFDGLLAKGDAAKTQKDGLQFYQQADDLLIKEMPYVPVYFYRINAAFSQHVKGVRINLLNQVEWTKVEKVA
ncbi:peptide ABC transporter substrate-binding protein [Streptosporangium sp. NBC_01756]|uniref:peptide ABC transporter substrate-binding protein n=1 Tax=Streptosporangium sp. NBC_01756 TaxID=2975950 RepID=UPI002DD7A4BA|nr:ABC transporter substrate-binding protein [Streptosporangium sp. NBC_01756]WSC89801.1 ABC transporter substrate-binding protein [Streptosporangium sp. NBC_01756]